VGAARAQVQQEPLASGVVLGPVGRQRRRGGRGGDAAGSQRRAPERGRRQEVVAGVRLGLHRGYGERREHRRGRVRGHGRRWPLERWRGRGGDCRGETLLELGVPVVLDVVVRPALQLRGYQRPPARKRR
jgi:hypothetical protein